MADGATVVRREDNERVLVEAVILRRRVLLIPIYCTNVDLQIRRTGLKYVNDIHI